MRQRIEVRVDDAVQSEAHSGRSPMWIMRIFERIEVVDGFLGVRVPREETEILSLTSAAACRRFAGVIRFSAPISSSLPQRPQFDSSVFRRSNCARLTDWARPSSRGCAVELTSQLSAMQSQGPVPQQSLHVILRFRS